MKIKYASSSNEREFGDLCPGDVFRYNNRVYIKTDGCDSVDLDNGDSCCVGYEDMVTELEVELVIS